MKIRISNSGFRTGNNKNSVGFGPRLVKKATMQDIIRYAAMFIFIAVLFIIAGVAMIINIDDVVRFLGLIFIIPGIGLIYYAIKKIRDTRGGDTDLYLMKSGRGTSLVDGMRIGYPMRHKDLTKEQNAYLERNAQLMMRPGLILGFLIPLVLAVVVAYFINSIVLTMLMPEGGEISSAVNIFAWVVSTLIAFIPIKLIIGVIFKAVKVAKNI